MAQYQVPQFIDIEDKIIGPLTIKQFIYIAIAFLIGFFTFFVLQFFIWLIFVLIIGSIAFAFAFIKYNGRPFGVLVISMFNYFWKPRVYRWKKTETKGPTVKGDIEDLNTKLKTSTEPVKRERPFKIPFLQRLRKTKEKYQILRKVTGEKEVARRVDYR